MLYGALELTAKILGICKEYEAQEIVREIANSLTMPIDSTDLVCSRPGAEMLRGFLPRPLHRGDPVRIL